jgi:hypothetical protein
MGSSGGNENINGFLLLPLVESGILIEVIQCLVDVGKACHISMINVCLERVGISLSISQFSIGLQRMSFLCSPQMSSRLSAVTDFICTILVLSISSKISRGPDLVMLNLWVSWQYNIACWFVGAFYLKQ